MNQMWRYRQRTAFENMWRDAARKRRREQFLAGPLGWVIEGPSSTVVGIIVIALIFVLTMFGVVRALGVEWREYPVPSACKALADRYGYSYLLTREEALAALIKLENKRYWPGVAQCLKAVNGAWRIK